LLIDLLVDDDQPGGLAVLNRYYFSLVAAVFYCFPCSLFALLLQQPEVA
jgi:hypothetical protein